jgi:glycosyltransferase involved in cell wall biosynthesis
MKILIVTARYYPEQFSITNIAEELFKMGNSITVLTGKPNYGYGKIVKGYENINYQEINGIKIHRVNERVRKSNFRSLVLNYLSIYFEYKRFLKKHREVYDVVLSFGISPLFALHGIKSFCRRNGIPHVHYGVDLWPESFIATNYFSRKSLQFFLLKSYSRFLYKSCDYISFSSPSAEHYFHDYLRLLGIPFKHIYQPCLTPVPAENLISNHVYKKDGKLRILYCGTVGKFHRLDLFIEALNICEYKDKIEFHIIGSGSELDRIRNLVKSRELDNVVTFFGRIPAQDTANHYFHADVLFVPLYNNSHTSSLIPQKVIEYLMYSKPILGMLVGDGAKILSMASQHNIICDQTVESLVSAVDRLVASDINTLKQCGRQNRTFFLSDDKFSIESICLNLHNLLNESLINNATKRRIKK